MRQETRSNQPHYDAHLSPSRIACLDNGECQHGIIKHFDIHHLLRVRRRIIERIVKIFWYIAKNSMNSNDLSSLRRVKQTSDSRTCLQSDRPGAQHQIDGTRAKNLVAKLDYLQRLKTQGIIVRPKAKPKLDKHDLKF